MYESLGENLTSVDNTVTVSSVNDAYADIKDIFPALQKYKDEHNKANLQKLCVEIAEFCKSVYASTQNEQEREAYRAMVRKLND